MKKFLLSCCLALGIGANAQYSANFGFEGDLSTTPGFAYFGTGAVSTTVFCGGAQSFASTLSAAATSGGPFIDFSDLGQTGNGQAVNVSVNYRKTAGVGTLYLIYATYDPVGDIWTVTPFASKAFTAATVTTCTAFTGTIPSGTLDPTKSYGIGAYFSRTSGTGVLYFDDLVVSQAVVTTAPACTTFTTPANGATISAGQSAITWAAAPTAVNYKLKVGTTSGGTDIFNGTVSGTTQNVPLAVSSTYYASVVPSNLNGDATGCSEISFQTNTSIAYCSGSSASGTYEKISNAKLTKTSNSVVVLNNSSTGTTGYEDYASIATPVTVNLLQGSAYTFAATCTATTYSTDQLYVWIDYNGDGVFNETNEKVVTSAVGLAPWNGSFTVPLTAPIGTTRMRIRVQDTAGATPNSTACGQSDYGQVEDYKVVVAADPTLAVSDVNKATISVYPNPFTDVLKISDVAGVKSISVNDISGREVKSLAPSAEVNLSNLKTGLYIVNLKMEDGSVKSFKAIKK